MIAVGLVIAYLAKGSYHSLYYSIERPLKFFQTGALLEILHCAIGIVSSSVVLTSFQVMSRVFLIWAVTHSVKEVSKINVDSHQGAFSYMFAMAEIRSPDHFKVTKLKLIAGVYCCNWVQSGKHSPICIVAQ